MDNNNADANSEDSEIHRLLKQLNELNSSDTNTNTSNSTEIDRSSWEPDLSAYVYPLIPRYAISINTYNTQKLM
jgi:hypothetical protein